MKMAQYSVKTDDNLLIDKLINETDKSSVTINRFGGEVIGYRILDRDKSTELGLLNHDGLAKPQDGWKNHATVLFPIVGGLKNKKSQLGDKVISSRGNHGFARHSTFELVGRDTNDKAALIYRLTPNDEIREYYPFNFQLDITYQLSANELTTTFAITNTEKNRDIYFCFGWHPGFKTPVIDGKGNKTDCQILFKKGTYTKYHNNEECRLTGQTSQIELDGPLQWTEDELEATIMLEIDEPANRTCALYDPAAGLKIELDFKEMPHLGLWSEPGCNFICIEPWQGMDDHEQQETFDKKVGIAKLAPGQTDKRSITVRPTFV